jgi:hypothetical protein
VSHRDRVPPRAADGRAGPSLRRHTGSDGGRTHRRGAAAYAASDGEGA